MRILSWDDLSTEDLSFVKINVAKNIWQAKSATHYTNGGRTDNMVFLMLSGARQYCLLGDDQPFEVHPDDLMFMPAGCCYDSYVLHDESTDGINLNFTLLDSDGNRCCIGTKPVILRRGVHEELRQIIRNIHLCSLQHGSRLRVKELMMVLLARICDDNTLQVPEEIRPAVRYMKEHLDTPVAIGEMAHLCHMSERTFSRRFVQAFQETPSAWYRRIRLLKGRELLQGGLYTVEQTAHAVGFYDTAHFCRAYTVQFGEAPMIARGEMRWRRLGG